ncbi:hypothetical protein [Aeromonas hydrophila]|uniref:hypothetical protein n=1 Tax=Aeromonas hydrophila TaxID=644 RepID=UPI0030D063F3
MDKYNSVIIEVLNKKYGLNFTAENYRHPIYKTEDRSISFEIKADFFGNQEHKSPLSSRFEKVLELINTSEPNHYIIEGDGTISIFN